MHVNRSVMGMPAIVEIVDKRCTHSDVDDIFNLFIDIDNRFSTYKQTSEITKINNGEIAKDGYSQPMVRIFELAKRTKQETDGFFDIGEIGSCDPSGIVKGWAIQEAAKLLDKKGFANYYLEIAGDIQVRGKNSSDQIWKIGVRNPFNSGQIIKVLSLSDEGIATSGNYERGVHIHNPKEHQSADTIASMTVIGPNIYEADRFATAAFAMGEAGIQFIEAREGLEGYMVNKQGLATMTTGLGKYLIHD